MNSIRTLLNKHIRIWAPIILFFLAFLLRFAHLSKYQGNPEYLHPVMDEGYHYQWAQILKEGHLFPEESFFRAPLYPYFLGFLLLLTGDNLHYVRILQIILGSFSIVFIYYLALRFFSWGYSFLCGLIAAFTFYLVFYSGELLIPVLVVFLHTIFMLTLFKAMESNRIIDYIKTGLLAGLSALARPNILLPIIILTIFLMIRKRQLLKPLMIVSSCIFIILPVTVINYIASDDFVLIASQGGVNFYIGNNSESDGLKAVVPGQRADWWGGYNDAISYAEKSRGSKLKPSQVSDFYYDLAFDWFRQHPFSALIHFLKKVFYFFHGFDFPNNKSIYFMKYFYEIRWVPFLNYSILSAFILMGIILSFRQMDHRERWLIFNIVTLSYVFSIVLFFVCARYRLSVLPFFLIYTVLTLKEIIKGPKNYRYKLMIGVVVLLVLTNIPMFRKSYNFGDFAVLHGKKYRDLDEMNKSEWMFNIALGYNHPLYIVANELGINAYKNGDLEKAMDHFRQSLKDKPGFPRAINNLALCYFDKEDYQQAFDLINSIELSDVLNDPSILSLFFDIYFVMDKPSEFLKVIDTATLEQHHLIQLADKADELLEVKLYKYANMMYYYLYARNYKNPELLNNLAITEYQLGNTKQAMLFFTMSGSDEAKQNIQKLQALGPMDNSDDQNREVDIPSENRQ